MIRRNWDNDEWKTLIHTINRGNCILMLGPDASFEPVNGKAQPLTERLANELAGKIEAKISTLKIDPSNLAQVAHYYSMETGRNGLEAKVEIFYEERAHLTSEFHEDLAVLPFYFAVTSSPDRMFFNALEKAGKKPMIKGYNFRGTTSPMVTMGSAAEPLLFNLYGRPEEPESLVLTESDLLDFLVAVVSGNPPLPKNIISELHARNKSFLFLGFGFRHWYLRVLLHVLQGDKKQAHSFALEKFPQDLDEFQHTILFFENSHCKIHLYDKEFKSFVKELRERYEQEGSAPAAAETKPEPEDAPTIFICHASENKDFAGSLYQKLERAGFAPWLDKESLRGGDDWDKVIRKAIEKEIDYVVVLQSHELLKKFEGYVNKEINLALDRQDEFRRGIRFIIPIKIDDCPILEELEHLHTIDFSVADNIEEVVKTIRRDQTRRKGVK
ncbi:MAG: TIR domain-containing protein [Candidatus Aminicenantes bacterium]|nr:TIR domain-containing protein [Candidatus Aminicenantes bacterium]NIM77529.1 TIR domain-containing protein [Candidatus Aminicenantes bacterium]NIN16845.1 TIR domain-containing protein [Candidatus Aminicenantes bacterium]NIN40723.1 TIR domain-containing protein [Candidatus Aminicenantes bacterium]NIN83532.1 TIR domain-containing protein [Candidatus Aminicenantes bacterium]